MPPLIKVGDQPELIPTSKFPYGKFIFENFNPVQSRLFEFYDKDYNCIIAAATSSGKTAISEMVLSYEIRMNRTKGIYVCPLKALAQEKYDEWTSKNHHFNDLNISICTGDYQLTERRKKELENADLIIMTAEMTNSRVRNFKSEKSQFLKEVGTLVVDELHLLGVPNRGDHLEVGLMKFTEVNPSCRIIGLSATMPNVDEISSWTSYVLNKKQTVLITSNYRPCPLYIHYEKYEEGFSYDEKERQKVNLALEIVEYYSEDKFLIFAHTKRTGNMMKEALIDSGINAEFHNADLGKAERIKLESKFKNDPKFRVIIATSTLAWGCYKFGSLIQMASGVLIPVEEVTVGDHVLAFDGNEFKSKKVLRAAEKTAKMAYKITLQTGEVCEVDSEHIFYGAIRRNSPDWISVKDLRVGDFLAVPKRFSFNENLEFSDLGYAFGYSAGDGCLCMCGFHANGEAKYSLDICAGSEDVEHLLYVKDILSKVLEYPIPDIKEDSNGVWHIRCEAKQVTDRFLGIVSIGRTKHKLTVPIFIQENRCVLRSYLSGLFDADGGVVNHNNGNFSLELTSISKVLISQVQQLLLTFGIRSSIGRKRVKNTIINGRFQFARRKYIYRLRIYNQFAKIFANKIGFKLERKRNDLFNFVLNANSCHNTKSIIPVRDLIKIHADANGVSSTTMCNSVGNRAWSILNVKELTRSTIEKILKKFPKHSKLNEVYNSDLLWSKVIKVEKVKGGKFKEIEVEDLNCYVAGGILSHNCNLPARRVIILGVHRGLEEVAVYDISQMIGRSGRPTFDPAGDAYVLLPEKTFDMHKLRLKKPNMITSQMLEQQGGQYKILAFHIVSEIHQENIQSRDDVKHWFSRSLACWQTSDIPKDIVDHTLDSLKKCGAVWEEENILTATSIGKISSMFYYSPFDVSDLKKNFNLLFDEHKEEDDYWLSMVLGNLDTHRFGIVSRNERDEMYSYAVRLNNTFGQGTVWEPAIKASYAYYLLLNGKSSVPFGSLCRGFQFDFPRLSQVLKSLDGYTGKWGKRKWFDELELRIRYGVKGHLVRLCQLPDVGKVRAVKLWDAGICDLIDVLNNPVRVRSILKMKPEKIENILAEAKKLSFLS